MPSEYELCGDFFQEGIMMTHASRVLPVLTLATALLGGCSGRSHSRPAEGIETGAADSAAAARDSIAGASEPHILRVSNVMIGKRIGEGNRVAEPTFQFAPSDTVYVSVSTEGPPESTQLSAKWLSQKGKVIDSTAKTLEPKGSQITEFHVAPAKGWPEGVYLVTIYGNGDSMAAKTFQVKK
jgi:hypothetical protein